MLEIEKGRVKKRSMGGGLSVGFFGGAFVRYKLPIYSKAV